MFDVVRSTVPRMTLDESFEAKDEVANAVREQLTHVMHSFGFEILKALVTDLTPAPKVGLRKIKTLPFLCLAVLYPAC